MKTFKLVDGGDDNNGDDDDECLNWINLSILPMITLYRVKSTFFFFTLLFVSEFVWNHIWYFVSRYDATMGQKKKRKEKGVLIDARWNFEKTYIFGSAAAAPSRTPGSCLL